MNPIIKLLNKILMLDFSMLILNFQVIIFPFYQFVLIYRINGKFFSTTDLSAAFYQVAPTPETQKLVHFVVEIEQKKYKRNFHGLKALPGFFTRIMSFRFAHLIK